jgi:hypothetical protein
VWAGEVLTVVKKQNGIIFPREFYINTYERGSAEVLNLIIFDVNERTIF